MRVIEIFLSRVNGRLLLRPREKELKEREEMRRASCLFLPFHGMESFTIFHNGRRGGRTPFVCRVSAYTESFNVITSRIEYTGNTEPKPRSSQGYLCGEDFLSRLAGKHSTRRSDRPGTDELNEPEELQAEEGIAGNTGQEIAEGRYTRRARAFVSALEEGSRTLNAVESLESIATPALPQKFQLFRRVRARAGYHFTDAW